VSFSRTNRQPSYRLHKPSGQAVVTLCGHDIYLGAWSRNPDAPSRREYDRLISEWLAAGRCLPNKTSDLTVAELAAAYKRHAAAYYSQNGKPTNTFIRSRLAMRRLGEVYGDILVGRFGPLSLQALQTKFVAEGKARPYVNQLIDEVKRAFRWGASRELFPISVYQALCSVSNLRKGHTEAREPALIRPVADTVVAATLPLLPKVLQDMVRIHRLLGCRPGELCILRPIDVSRDDPVWQYRPQSHKTEHRGHRRVIYIGPRAQAILEPYLSRDRDEYCFVPRESEIGRLEERHRHRNTPMSCGNTPGTNRKRNAQRKAGQRYTAGTYANAVRRACDLADARAHEVDPDISAAERIVPRWSPNQLRHSAATEIRRKFGLEASQVILGHSNARITEVYAERDMALAARIARDIG
jgi:integrase